MLVWAAMAAFVRWCEEPFLATRYGQQYEDFRGNVQAWWPRLTPWTSQAESLAVQARQVCPYSRAINGNVDVQITVDEA